MAKRKATTKPIPVAKKRVVAPAASTAIQCLKVTLQHVDPSIWRRVEMRDGNLEQLHAVIQISMGWENSHLWCFFHGRTCYGDPEVMDDVLDASRTTISTLVDAGATKLRYVYDMGDDWTHLVQFEKIGVEAAGAEYPRCTGGERACPPEDCGGAWAYGDFLAAIRDPRRRDHQDMLDWIGGAFDPDHFDLKAINRRLHGRAN